MDEADARDIVVRSSNGVATPLWAKCKGEAHTPKSGKLESHGTPENSKLDCRGQISSNLSVPGVIGKALTCRCPKWPRIGHLDLCSPSYGQKKGQESTCSRRALRKCDMALESSLRGLQVWFRPRPDLRSRRGATKSQSPESPNWDNFGTPLWESREKEPIGCHSRG